MLLRRLLIRVDFVESDICCSNRFDIKCCCCVSVFLQCWCVCVGCIVCLCTGAIAGPLLGATFVRSLAPFITRSRISNCMQSHRQIGLQCKHACICICSIAPCIFARLHSRYGTHLAVGFFTGQTWQGCYALPRPARPAFHRPVFLPTSLTSLLALPASFTASPTATFSSLPPPTCRPALLASRHPLALRALRKIRKGAGACEGWHG
jgi:hypothetical protein